MLALLSDDGQQWLKQVKALFDIELIALDGLCYSIHL
jgi:hypothetical protein